MDTTGLGNVGLESLIPQMAKAVGKSVVVQDKHLRILYEAVSPELAKHWDKLTEALRDRQRLPETLRDRHRLPRNAPPPALQALAEGLAYRLAMPIVTQGIGRGYLSFLAASPAHFDDVDRLALGHGASVCALEMSRAKAINEIEKKARGDFLTNLMNNALSDAEIQTATERFNHDMNSAHVAVVLRWYGPARPSGRRLETLINGVVANNHVQALTQYQEHETRVYYAVQSGDGIAQARQFGEDVIAAAARENKHALVAVGIGHLASKLSEWRASYQGASNAADIAQRLHSEKPMYAGEIDIFVLLTRPDFRPDLRALRDKMIGELLRYEEKQGADLLLTLEAFFDCHGNHNQTASRLSVHRNTLFYRMNRITEITKLNLDQPEVRLAMHLALKIHRLLASEEGGKA
jgi:PucR family transcriptional regulator, purine catabolism regulatory protein